MRIPKPVVTQLLLKLGPTASVVVMVLVLSGSLISQTFQVIYQFAGTADGNAPITGLTSDFAGNLYGTASSGGSGSCDIGCGTIFELAPTETGWNFSLVYSFQSLADGSTPASRMVWGSDGSLYGTTLYGGQTDCYPTWGCGLIFKLSKTDGVWTKSTVDQFGSSGGWSPSGDLVLTNGILYGTTNGGGSTAGCHGAPCDGAGVVYQVTLTSDPPSREAIYTFAGSKVNDGANPAGGVMTDGTGNLFGTTAAGGEFGSGIVFELDPGAPAWREMSLYDFHGGLDGAAPTGGLIADEAGNLFGSTEYNGLWHGAGTVFKLSLSGGSWTHRLLAELPANCVSLTCVSGNGPRSSLVMDSAGNLYGTTVGDGKYGKGSVFKLTPSQQGWNYSSLHDFTGGSDGANPWGSVTIDAHGNVFGTASAGGDKSSCSAGCGVVFEITP